MLASSRICSARTDTRSSACNSELVSVTRKALRKPQSLRRERSKRSTNLTGSCMRIRSRSMRTLVNTQRRHQTFVPFGHLDALTYAPAMDEQSQNLVAGPVRDVRRPSPIRVIVPLLVNALREALTSEQF